MHQQQNKEENEASLAKERNKLITYIKSIEEQITKGSIRTKPVLPSYTDSNPLPVKEIPK